MTKESNKAWIEGIVAGVMLHSKGIPSNFISNLEKVGYKIVKSESENERLKSDREWISVKDRLPEKSGDYIIYGRFTKDCPMNVYEASFSSKLRYFYRQGIKSKHVTHWMNLPSKPKI